MTGSGRKIAVPIEWARQGKAPDDRGYRLLSHSTGDISARNFEEILDRFAPGTLDKLPQVTVSYTPGGDGGGYLSMAFHEEAAGGLDRLGRDVTFTRFFCVPYRRLAAGAVSYLAMYQAFERIRLPDTAAPPFSAELSCAAATIPGHAARALPVAELLLTGNPVCIVDAESTSMPERLAYIDTVMSLLPYGMRAEMAAATWTSSTYRLHKFRLFFSEAPRRAAESGVDDHLVRWRPDAMVITPAPKTRVPAGYGTEYREWLQQLLEGPSVITELAQDTTARGFKAADIDQMLDGIHAKQQTRWWSRPAKRREIAAKDDEGPVRAVPWQDPGPAKNAPLDVIEHLIEKIATSLHDPAGVARDVRPYLDRLRDELERVAQPSAESRERYRARIAGYRLLRENLPIGKGEKAGFYKLLLRAAFGKAIGYLDYCKIEKMLGDKIPDKPLLQAVDEMLGADPLADPRALFIVRYHLGKGKYAKSGFGPIGLLEIAADPQLREEHAKLIWNATIGALSEARSDEVENVILPRLRDRGFLALELHARDPLNLESQVNALMDLLGAVYRDRVGRAFPDILSGGRRYYPTLGLLLAVCQFTADEDADAMLTSFLCGLVDSREVPEAARLRLARFGYSRGSNSDYEETADAPAERRPTQLDVPSSMTGAVRYMNSMQPADPPKEKRGFIRRITHLSGEFTVSESKYRSSDDR